MIPNFKFYHLGYTLALYCDDTKWHVRLIKSETTEFPHGIPFGVSYGTKQEADQFRTKIAKYLNLTEII